MTERIVSIHVRNSDTDLSFKQKYPNIGCKIELRYQNYQPVENQLHFRDINPCYGITTSIKCLNLHFNYNATSRIYILF